MEGITSYGAYIPLFRIKRDDIAKAWGGGSQGGEKSVANFDEDSLTMGVAAAQDCLKGVDRKSVDSIYFASTTPAYKEKQTAPFFPYALNMKSNIFVTDLGDSIRAGTNALKVALDAVKAGNAKHACVIASDTRKGSPRSEFEQIFGDGAASFLVGKDNVIASLEAFSSYAHEILDFWQTKDDNFIKTWEDRWVLTEGYLKNVSSSLKDFLKKNSLTPKDFNTVVLYAPDARRHREMAGMLGFDYKTQVQNPFFDTVGNTGCAFALMQLAAALEEAKPGSNILLINYGDGTDIFHFKVTEAITRMVPRRGIKAHLASKKYITNYEKFITHRQVINVEPATRRPSFVSYPPILARERQWILGLNASKCQNCGRLFLPPQRICLYCKTKDKFDLVDVSDAKGILFTFNLDNLATSPESPEVFARVHLEKSGDKVGFYCRVTDRDPALVKLDLPVELTFRKMYEAGGYPNYFWKAMPVRV